MTISFNTTVNSVEFVLDDYVIACGELFLYKRNRDFTPVIYSFDMDLSQGGSPALPFVPMIGQVIVMKIDGQERAAYEITNVFDNSKEHKFSITLTSRLNRLKIPLCTTNLWGLIANTSGLTFPLHYYNPDDAMYVLSGGYVMVLWAIKNMFAKASLALDVSQVEYTIGTSYNGREVKHRDYMIDLGMLWCLNQNSAMSYYDINGNNEYLARRITFWDFVSLACSYFGWKILDNGADSYILRDMSYGQLFAFGDDFKFDYAVENFSAKNTSARATFMYHDIRDYYYGSPVTLNRQNAGEESSSNQESLPWYNNLLFGIINASWNAIEVFFSIDDYFIMTRRNAYNSLTKPYRQETVETSFSGDIYNCLEHSLNVEKRTSRIVNEVIL